MFVDIKVVKSECRLPIGLECDGYVVAQRCKSIDGYVAKLYRFAHEASFVVPFENVLCASKGVGMSANTRT